MRPALSRLLLTILLAGGAGTIALPVSASRTSVVEAGAGALLVPGSVDDGVRRVFLDIEEAWRSGRADPLALHIGARGLGLPGADGASPRRVSRNQALYILGGMLQGSETIRFEFLRFRNLEGNGGRPNGAALRETRLPSGASRRDLIFVALAKEGERWTIDEIRTKRP